MKYEGEVRQRYYVWRYHARRFEGFKLLGDSCVKCGSRENLEFDHIDPSTKSFALGEVGTISLKRWLEEAKKCQVLCRSCHLEKSTAEQSVAHGGGMSGKKNCKCRPCLNRKNEYMKKYKKQRRLANART